MQRLGAEGFAVLNSSSELCSKTTYLAYLPTLLQRPSSRRCGNTMTPSKDAIVVWDEVLWRRK